MVTAPLRGAAPAPDDGAICEGLTPSWQIGSNARLITAAVLVPDNERDGLWILQQRGTLITPSVGNFDMIVQDRMQFVADLMNDRYADLSVRIQSVQSRRPSALAAAASANASGAGDLQEASTAPSLLDRELANAWNGLPLSWWTAISRDAGDESALVAPEAYLRRLTIAFTKLSDLVASTGASQHPCMAQLLDCGEDGLAFRPVAPNDGQVLKPDGEALIGRELFQLVVGLESPDRTFVAVLLPPGAFRTTQHPLVLPELIDPAPDGLAYLEGIVHPGILWRSDLGQYEILRTMRIRVTAASESRQE